MSPHAHTGYVATVIPRAAQYPVWHSGPMQQQILVLHYATTYTLLLDCRPTLLNFNDSAVRPQFYALTGNMARQELQLLWRLYRRAIDCTQEQAAEY